MTEAMFSSMMRFFLLGREFFDGDDISGMAYSEDAQADLFLEIFPIALDDTELLSVSMSRRT